MVSKIGDIFIAKSNDDIICLQVMSICDDLHIVVQEVYPEIIDIVQRDRDYQIIQTR
ncbi:MAG: hypothetical protein ACLR84_00250 [Clostridia bacterium]